MIKEADTETKNMGPGMKEDVVFRNTILSTLQEAAIDGILVVDDNGRIISFNRRFVDMWDLPGEVVESKSDERALQIVLDKLVDPQRFLEKVKHLYEQKHEVSREDISLKDGRTFDRYSAPMFGADSRYYGRVWYFRDITERKQLENMIQEMSAGLQERVSERTLELNKANKKLQEEITERKKAEEALRESETKLQAIFDTVGTGIFIIDKDTQVIIEANQTAVDMTGMPKENIVGRICHSLVCPAQAGKCPVKDLGQSVDHSERKLLCADGHVKDILKTVYPIIIKGRNCYLENFIDITGRKQAEETLRESEERYRAISEYSHDAICILDEQGKIIWGNDKMQALGGYSLEQMYEAPSFVGLIAPESIEFVISNFYKVLAGEPYEHHYTFYFVHAEGEKRLCEKYMMDFKDKHGKRNLIVSMVDITDLKALEEEQERSRAFIENVEDACWEMDLSGNLILYNEPFLQITGYTYEEYMALSRWDRHPTREEAKRVFKIFDDVHRTGIPAKNVEYQIIHKDGGITTSEVSVSQIRDKSGNPVGFRGVGRDITSRKRAEEELLLNSQRMRALLHLGQMTEATLKEVTDFALEEMVRLTQSEIGYLAFLDKDESVLTMNSWSKAAMAECAISEKPTHYQVVDTGLWGEAVRQRRPVITNDYASPNPWKKGYPAGHVRISRHMNVPIFDGSRIVIVAGVGNKKEEYVETEVNQLTLLMQGMWRLIEHKRAEEEKANLQDQFLQAQKMESVGRLAGGVAHDFNNMLGVIFGHTEMAMEQVDPAHPIYSDLQEIRKAAERSADLTRQLLAFARKQTVAPKVLDLNETVAGMLKMLQRLIGEDIHLAWLPGINPWPVKIDPSQLDQIFANLCVNARDAIAGVGKITIETGNVIFDEAYCTDHMGSVPGEYALLAVSDDGCGMDKNVLSNLFEPFFTTKGVGKGTGLGLATVYGIIKQNNGYINVYSEPERGTSFKIYLPRHMGEEQQPPMEGTQKQALRGQETLLLVEDEPAILNMSKLMLEKQGYQVLAAGTPGEAIRLAGEHTGEIHLLLTDVVMPETNGRDLADKMLSIFPNIKCLFTSGYTADVIAHHGVLDEGVQFIQKPFSRKDLAAKVREALDQK